MIRRHNFFRSLPLLLLLADPGCLAAQVALGLAVDTNRVEIGDSVRIHLQVTSPKELAIERLDSLALDGGAWQLLSKSGWTERLDQEFRIHERSWLIQPLDTGLLRVAPLALAYSLENKPYQDSTNALEIRVHPPKLEPGSDISDIRDILETRRPNWLPGLLALALILAGLAFWIWKKYRRAPAAAAWENPVPETDLDGLLRELETLRDSELYRLARSKPFFRQLSLVLRQGIVRACGVQALHLSTSALSRKLRLSLPAHAADGIQEVLERCDLVKFSLWDPAPPDFDEAWDAVRSILVEFKRMGHS